MKDCLSELVPPEYVGRTWDYGSNDGIVHSRFPPIREGTDITQEFIDFQNHAHAVKREKHPEYYCVECRAVYVTAICPACKSARVVPTGAPRTELGTPYRCRGYDCTNTFMAALICGKCRTNLGEAASLLPPPTRGVGSKPRAKADELYPD